MKVTLTINPVVFKNRLEIFRGKKVSIIQYISHSGIQYEIDNFTFDMDNDYLHMYNAIDKEQVTSISTYDLFNIRIAGNDNPVVVEIMTSFSKMTIQEYESEVI